MQPTAEKSKTQGIASKPANAKPPDIASASVPDTLATLHVNADTGLTNAEVDANRKDHGYNEVAVKKEHPVLNFLKKFWGISAWMLELIMVLSAVLKKFSDLAVVGALLIVNAVLSFMQEQRAAGVVETLRKRLQVSARVRREGKWQVIPARELVPGDIVRVRPGDIIPADVKLLTGGLTTDESALTGESKDVDKAPGAVLSSGSVVRRGEGNGVVILTGAKTYFGRTTELVQKARPKLHIEAVVSKVVRWLFVIVGALLAVVIALSLIRGAPLLEMVPLMLVLLMSAVPVALPVMFTVSMAVGSKELAKRGVLVTRLSASEDAATMDVLCVDKTGTITMNQLAVTGVIPLEHATEADVLFAGALASQEANQDPIDLAFLIAAKERHIFDNVPKVTPVSFAPFDAKNRRTEAVVEQNGQRLRVMKGAMRTVAEACGLQAPAIEPLEARVSASAAKGYRTLAAPLATSVAVLTAIPTSAWRSAGASLTPSPVMPVTCPAACRCFTTMYLSSGNTSANPSAPANKSTALLLARAPAAFRSATRRMLGKPTPLPISSATGRASPVSIFTGTPKPSSSEINCLASGRGGSYSATNPTRVGASFSGPRATARVR